MKFSLTLLVALMALGLAGCSRSDGSTSAGNGEASAASSTGGKPALTVTTTRAQMQSWEQKLSASGNVQPWQEATIGSEISGGRLSQVLVNVGDTVKRGQLLAVIDDESTRNDVAQYAAAVAEAEANLQQARVSADRAQALDTAGAISRQDKIQYDTTAKTNAAKLASAQAQLAAQQLKLRKTRIVATDDGVISSRTATLGAVQSSGSELFKLIRQGRLEWRAELRAEQLPLVRPGLTVQLRDPAGQSAQGTVRQIAPTVDTSTRSALVYVDIATTSDPNRALKAGVLATGDLLLGRTQALALAQTAVVSRDGYSYAMKVADDQRVHPIKITLGRRQGDWVEVLGGLGADDAVVATGAAFLNDGDRVSVVQAAVSSNNVPSSNATSSNVAAATKAKP